MKNKKIKLTDKFLQENYGYKKDAGTEVVRLCMRILAGMSVFVIVALGADIYQLLH